MNQVRFISICPKGHIDDFPWRQLLGCARGDQCGRMTLNEQGSSDLGAIRVSCECGRSSSLAGVTNFERDEHGVIQSTLSRKIREANNSESAGECQGRCLWHGPEHSESCAEDIIATFPNATNVYHSRTRTSIFIPVPTPKGGEIQNIVDFLEASLNEQQIIKTWWNLDPSRAPAELCRCIDANPQWFDDISVAKQEATTALEQFFSGIPALQEGAPEPEEPESDETAFRRVEFNVMRKVANEKDLRTRLVDVPSDVATFVSRLVMVERLRETRILYGFDRFASSNDGGSAAEIGDGAIAQLFAKPPALRWLPGSVVFGEGLYFELCEETLQAWLNTQNDWLNERLYGPENHNFAGRTHWPEFRIAPPGEVSRDWVARYLLVHTTAHIVINQLVFECGYSTASLRERLYVSADPAAPQAGILIYTSAGDSEGTLGGLVRLGNPDRFVGVLRRAIQRASWCSADPVCSEVSNRQDGNLAACHSCVLLPETSCENFNRALDRALAVGLPAMPNCGFFSQLTSLGDRVPLQ